MEQNEPSPARNAPKWAPLLRAAATATTWATLPWDRRVYRSLQRIRRRLGLTGQVAVVGRRSDGHIWIGPESLARVLRDGLRGPVKGARE